MPPRSGVFRFGIFELDESSGELRRNGSVVHLPPQPFQILVLLARNAGEVVDRNRIRHEVWGDTAVDFDRSLNVAIAQIRAALNDNAESPRFIQTLPRKGYRFLAEPEVRMDAAAPLQRPDWINRRTGLVVAAAIFLAVGLGAGSLRLRQRSSEPLRVAVLPFEDLSPGSVETDQADGLFDDLLTRLGGIQPNRIRVIGRRSVAPWKTHSSASLREIGDRLNVRYAVESSIRRDGDGLRVAVRLVETGDEAVLWSGTFQQDRSLEAFEEAVVARASAGVLTTLFPTAVPRAAEAACRDGWEKYQTGRLLANRGGVRDLERSLSLFQQSGCGPAKAALAEAIVRLARMGRGGAEPWEAARKASQAALGAGDIAAAHVALGNIAFWHDWKWQAARQALGKALELNPSDPDAHHDLAWLQVALGLHAEAEGSLETAIAIDPLSARTRMDAAWLWLQMGRFDRAAAEARRTLELNPEMMEARACLSRALLYAGDARGAVAAIEPMIAGAVAGELKGLPAEEAARRLIEIEIHQDSRQDPYERAWRLAWLGSRGEALTALEEAFRRHSLMMPLTAVDPAFRSIRGEARFQKIVREMGL